MKFKDLQTGLVVNHDFASLFILLCDRNLCQNCPVNKILNGNTWGGRCVDWVKNHMVEAATLAGYEYLGDTDERCCPSCANIGRYSEVCVDCKPDGNGGRTMWKLKDHSTDTTKKVEIPANSMTAMEYITHTFGRDEVFCQTAEESVELAKACDDLRRASMRLSKAVLKLRRAEHGTTPVSLTEATRAVLEECADVTVCIRALEAMGVFNREELDNVVREKLERWEIRAREYEKRVDHTASL